MGKETLTTGEANGVLRELEKATGLSKAKLAGLAAIISIKSNGAMDFSDRIYDQAGGFRIHAANVDPEHVLSTLVSALYSLPEDRNECIDLIRNHVNEGTRLLQSIFSEVRDPAEFFCELESRYATRPEQEAFLPPKPSALNIIAGRINGDSTQPFVWPVNEARTNPHTAIIGASGSGKTQLLLDLLLQLYERSNRLSNFVFLAYKNDDGVNDFADSLGIEVMDPDIAPLPINPFILNDYSDREIAKSAQEKCDMVAEFESSIGSRQKGFLRQGIIQAYQNRKNHAFPYPDFDEVRDCVLADYGEHRDSLTELLDSFVNLSLFEKTDAGADVRRSLSGSSLLIRLQGIPDKHRALVASLVLETFVRECNSLPAADIDHETDTRTIRSCIVIDEAHNYLKGRNLFLEKLLRESRQAGFVIMLASQTPKSLCAKQDLLELIRNFFVFRCPVSGSEARLLTGCRENVKRQVMDEIQNLPPGYCFVNRSPVGSNPYCQIEAAQYYKHLQDL